MASISGFGNIGGATPPDRFKGVPSGVQKAEAESNPQVGNDGLDVNFHQPAAPERTTLSSPAQETPQKAEVRPQERAERSSVPVTLSMDDGLFGINSIGDNAASEKIGLSAFTNGLGSTKLIGLSGNILADANLFRQQQ